jgi:uncharacterized protein (TIGR00251 family)
MSERHAHVADEWDRLVLRDVDHGVELQVRVAPRASRSGVRGVHDGALKCSLASPPVDGAANAELLELLAELLGVPKRCVSLQRGERGRSKTVRIVGLDTTTARERLRSHDAATGTPPPL